MLDSKGLKGSGVITQALGSLSLSALQNPINPLKRVSNSLQIKSVFCILETNEGEMYRDFWEKPVWCEHDPWVFLCSGVALLPLP